MNSQTSFFHNTINLLHSEVREAEKQTIHQSEVILMLFKENPDRWFTPWQVYELFEGRFLIGSVRRTLTDLSHPKVNELIKSEYLIPERKGKPNYQWKLK